MAKSSSSRRWVQEHREDAFVKQALAAGYRSRAVYKLQEIDRRDHLLRQGMRVVDLGAAPGGWSQYAAERVGAEGRVLALDLIPMDPLPGVASIEGDFRETGVLERMLAALEGRPAALVMSDMAPNMSGIGAVDQPRAMYLAELAADLARQVLGGGGAFLVKVFQGEGFDQYINGLRGEYAKVCTRKPKASRPRSREVYVLGRGYDV